MAMNEQQHLDAALEARARRAYELGRLRGAFLVNAAVVPLIAISIAGCGAPAATVAIGIALSITCTALLWRGMSVGRAVAPGLIAGAIPFAMPLLARATGHCSSEGCGLVSAACIAGGALGGILLAMRLSRAPADRPTSFFAAALVAGLTGTLGCVLLGAAGVLGMTFGLLATAGPVVALRRAYR